MRSGACPDGGLRLLPFTMDHVDGFLAHAASEGWLCDRWEFGFLLGAFPEGCLVAVDDGVPMGYVTAVRHGESGWIGNLLVPCRWRGQGVGTRLMASALEALDVAGVATVWLTASLLGKPIYEKLGFAEVDSVVRWQGWGRGSEGDGRGPVSLDGMCRHDCAGWGDIRLSLLQSAVARGVSYVDDDGFLVAQRTGDVSHLGPWAAATPDCAATLLYRALNERTTGVPVVLDSPRGNAYAGALLVEAGFSPVGVTTLMCRGSRPMYRPEFIYGLATLGSSG